MQWWKQLRENGEKNGFLSPVLLAAVISTVGIISWVSKLAGWPAAVDGFILSRTVDPLHVVTHQQIIGLNLPPVGFILTFFFLTSFILLLTTITYYIDFRELKGKDDGQKSFFAEFDSDAAQISHKLKLLNNPYERVIEDVTVTVEADGTAVMIFHREIRATIDPVYLLPWELFGDQPVESFSEIQLSVTSETAGHDIARLPFLNQPNHKGFFVVFLRGIARGESAVFTVSYKWPNVFRPLIDKGRDECEFEANAPLEKMRVRFHVHESLPVLTIRYTGNGCATPEGETSRIPSYRVYRWTVDRLAAKESARFSLERA